MKQALLRKDHYTGGYHAFKKILRIEEDGSKIISRDNTGWQHFKSDYISSAWLNPDGTRVPYCIPLDIDVKDTNKKWLDLQGKINWEKTVAFLQKKYPEIFGFLLFVVRSTGGKGIHLGIAISPIVKDGKDGSTKTQFLAKQAQIALIRLLNHHGLGGDKCAAGIVRDLPNWRRHETSKYSQAKQLYYNKDIHAEIKREKRNVISEILAVTNKLKECRPPAKKDQQGILHPHKTTEARLAKLYIDLFDYLGQTKCYSMAELTELTDISKATLRNILVNRPKSRPKWLNVNYLGRTEGYELWLDPEHGDIDRAMKLVENPEYASTFLRELKFPEEVEDGERNAWLSSAAIHYKWHGYSKHQTMIALNAHAKLIPGYNDSSNCKHLVSIVESIYRNQPQLFGVKSHLELPLVLNEKNKVKNMIEGPRRGREDSRNTHYSLAFTRRGNEKRLVLLEQIVTNSILERVAVKGSGYKLQLSAIQELLGKLEKKPSKLIVKGRSMLQGNPVVQKFAKYHGFEFEFAERSAEDKNRLREFREYHYSREPKFFGKRFNAIISQLSGSSYNASLLGELCSYVIGNGVKAQKKEQGEESLGSQHVFSNGKINYSSSEMILDSLKNLNWCLGLIRKNQGRVLFSPKRRDPDESYVLKSRSESSLFSVNESGKPLKNDDD
ncbi:MAG: hypothetical protein AB8G05_23020, partial [Oligoflexales bacterium]